MVNLMRGDILHAEAEALVNTVNCVGIMGRGVALQFRKAFPENYEMYRAVCERRELQPGKVLVYQTGMLTGPRYIINFPTKRHWKGKSRIEDIESGLDALVLEIRKRGIRSIAIPPLGCGLGGLRWHDVRPLIIEAFSKSPDVCVLLYEPTGAPPASEMVKDKKVPHMTAGRAVLLELMHRYLTVLMDPFLTLLEIHKLMYFMQESGQRLNLKFEKGAYGPYAKNLRHVLSIMEGHFITGYGDADDKPGRPIEILPGVTEISRSFLVGSSEVSMRLNRVAALIHGFETPHGMELLATVHWVATREKAASIEDVVRCAYAWNERKKLFTRKQIELAWRVLHQQGWLPTSAA